MWIKEHIRRLEHKKDDLPELTALSFQRQELIALYNTAASSLHVAVSRDGK